MAQFDLKNADMYLVDGYSEAGAVNAVAGYASGIATMVVDGWGANVIIPVGTRFSVAGETAGTVHTVSAHTETSGTTTSITFTPALTGAVVDNAVITVLPHKLRIRMGDGNLTHSEKRAIQYIKDRGRLDTARLGDQDPMDVRLDFMWEFLQAASGDITPTIENAFKREGLAADWVSTDPDLCAPFALDIYVQYSPVCENVELEEIILPMFRYEELNHDSKAGMVAVTGKCNVIAAIRNRVTEFTV